MAITVHPSCSTVAIELYDTVHEKYSVGEILGIVQAIGKEKF